METLNIKKLNELLKSKTVVAVERRTFFNTDYRADWTADCLILDDGSFVALCADGEIDYILLPSSEGVK